MAWLKVEVPIGMHLFLWFFMQLHAKLFGKDVHFLELSLTL